MKTREILFEYGFDSVNGIVKKHYYLHQIPNIATICDVWNILPLVYVRQFTGLTDKNGTRIFEGDLLKDLITTAILEVKFGFNKQEAYNGWYCEYLEFSRKTSINGDYESNSNSNIEVIGNIHQK